jgi:hypothetical protein
MVAGHVAPLASWNSLISRTLGTAETVPYEPIRERLAFGNVRSTTLTAEDAEKSLAFLLCGLCGLCG